MKTLILILMLVLFPVFCLEASNVTLEWDANSEPDLAGYKIYYKIGSSGEPYDGTGATEGVSPIDVSNVTTFTLNGLTEGSTYYFVATAYDTGDLESGYSNEVFTQIAIPDTAPSPPVNLRIPSSELIISNVNLDNYRIIQNGLGNGELVYVDRDYTFTDVPEYIQGVAYIKTANDDKSGEGDSFLSFDVNQDVTVYVGYDIRISGTPSWLLDFTDTGDEIVTSDTTFKLFAKDFSAGTITLGGNDSGGGGSMYTVIVTSKF